MFFTARGATGSLLGMLLFSGFLPPATGAQMVRFHDNWKYHDGDANGAEAPSFTDAPWETVFLPHPMSLVSPGGNCPTGTCWYRKHFSAEAYQGKIVVIEFQGAMQTADVYVNGTRVTTHRGGYDPFAIDITDNLRFNDSNVIAVRLDNTPSNSFPPGKSTPDFRYWGGLYRDVSLHVSDPIHISHPLVANVAGGGGVFVTYPSVGNSEAAVQVKTHVVNQRTNAASCVLTTTLIDDNGTLLHTATNSVTFTVTGPATLVTTENGPSVTVKAEAGIATALLRAGTTPGEVVVNATSGNLAKGSASVKLEIPGTTGIVAASYAEIMPSAPFSIRATGRTLFVKIPSAITDGAVFILFNAQGRVVGKWNLTETVTPVGLTSLPHGIYFGRVSSGADRFVRKLLW